jgi:hypothetical protein
MEEVVSTFAYQRLRASMASGIRQVNFDEVVCPFILDIFHDLFVVGPFLLDLA